MMPAETDAIGLPASGGLLLVTALLAGVIWAERWVQQRHQRRQAAPAEPGNHNCRAEPQQTCGQGGPAEARIVKQAGDQCLCGGGTGGNGSITDGPRPEGATLSYRSVGARQLAPASSPFAWAAQAASSNAEQHPQPQAASGTHSTLGRRNSPPHLSAILPPLPAQSSEPLPPHVSLGTPPAAAGALPRQLSSGSSGAAPAAPAAPAADRASLDELLSEVQSLSGPNMEQLLSGMGLASPAQPQHPHPQQQQSSQLASTALGPASPANASLQPAYAGSAALSDWEVSPSELEICRRPDGSLWQIGAGGFARVYRGLRFGVQPVAVKVLGPTAEARYSEQDDFRREVELVKACKDPNIVSFLGASLSRDFTLLVLELCEGGSLAANLRAGRITWHKRGKRIALDVARGLCYLHGRRLVHMDLKSGNILLDRHGTAKIADLGLARLITRELSSVTASVGTLDWAAPEVLLGLRVTERADIYSYGVCLWEICTQERVVRGRMRELVPPRDCPAEVARLVADCLNPDPSHRPSAQQLVERLLAVPASPPSPAAAAAGVAVSTGAGGAGAQPSPVVPPPGVLPAGRVGGPPRHPRSASAATLGLTVEGGGLRKAQEPAQRQGSTHSLPEDSTVEPSRQRGAELAVPAGRGPMARAASSPPDLHLVDIYGLGL